MKKIKKPITSELTHWYNEIKDYERLTLPEARSLYKMIQNNTGEKRKKYRERLILGTLYIVYHNITNSGLTTIKTPYYDIDDLINASIEIWITLIDEGILLRKEINFFSQIFHRDFYSILSKKLLYENPKYYRRDNYHSTKDYKVYLLIIETYLECISSNLITDNKSHNFCLNYCLDKFNIKNNEVSSKLSLILYNLTQMIDIEEFKKLSKTDLSYIKTFLFDLGLSINNKEILNINNFTNDIEEEILKEELRNYLYTSEALKPKEKEIILERYGFNDKPKTYQEIANLIGISRAGVEKADKALLKKLKRKKNIKSLYYNN